MESEKYYKTENRIAVNMISGLLVVGLYILVVYLKFVSPNPGLIYEFSFWGKAFIILVPIIIISQVLVMIVYAIINKIRTDQDMPTITDERDKLIEFRSLKVSSNINSLGFFLAMGSQAIGMQPIWLVYILIVSAFFSGLSQGFVSMILYRRGG